MMPHDAVLLIRTRLVETVLPPLVDEWLPEKHLARFVVEVIDGLDLRMMRGSYRGSGSARRHCCWVS